MRQPPPFRIEYRDAFGVLRWSERLYGPHAAAVTAALLRAAGAEVLTVFREGYEAPTRQPCKSHWTPPIGKII